MLKGSIVTIDAMGTHANIAQAIRAHWSTKHCLHWSLDVSLNDDQMRARCRNAGANLALVRRLVLNLFLFDTSCKGGIRTRRILAASSDA
jgi:predicted transposase YbfD/YdcC